MDLEAQRIMTKFPGKVPIIVKKDPRSTLDELDKCKFLVPEDLSWASFITVIRKRIPYLTSEQGLFIFVDNVMMNSIDQTVGSVYQQYKDKSGYLLIFFTNEAIFGGY